jgi:copper chaperone NosL
MNVQESLTKFYEFLDRPLFLRSRIVLALLVIPLVLTFMAPLWRISMTAPQYPNGLYMDIYTHKVDGGHAGHDITEINELNHYIGMKPIDGAALTDLDWIPFALGLLALLTLRCAAIGNVRALVDLLVVSGYVATFAFARFIYRLWYFGHSLNPEAPIHLPAFTPAIIGRKQVANFGVESWPRAGSLYVAIFLAGVVGVTLWHLIAGRRAALHKGERTTGPAAAAGPAPDAHGGE